MHSKCLCNNAKGRTCLVQPSLEDWRNRLLQSPLKFIRRCPTHPTHEFQTTASFSLSFTTRSLAWLGEGFLEPQNIRAQKHSNETPCLSAEGTEAQTEGSHFGLKVRVLVIWPTTSFLCGGLSSSDNRASNQEARAPGKQGARRSTQP